MRWWMVTRMRTMAVENADVKGMDYTILPSNVSMVEWQDGRGEIECNDRPRLRERFYDVTPYVPLFQQFMTKLEGLTLKQAKKVQADLINELFDLKRQAPYHYNVAAGSFDWDATDDAVTAMAGAVIPTLIGSAGSTGGSLTTLVAQINAGIVDPGNALVGHDNANVNSISNAFNVIGGNANSGDQLRDELNAIIGTIGDPIPGPNTINNKLQSSGSGATPAYVATPGLQGQLPHATADFSVIDGSYYPTGTAITFTGVSPIGGAGGVIPWTPIGQGTPVNLSPSEMGSIMSGIASRRQSLLTKRFNKMAAVNALTTVVAVIAYDVTTGW